jgi:hypothetical protein
MLPAFNFVNVDRLPVGELSVKLRSAGRTTLDVLRKTQYQNLAGIIFGGLLDSDSESDDSDLDSLFDDDSDIDLDEIDEREEENEMLEDLGIIYLQKVVELDRPRMISLRNIVRKNVTLASYSDDECWRLLRFRKDDLRNLITLLQIPPYLYSPDRHRYTSEFSMILFLRRMAYPGRLCDLEVEFGREHTSLSRSITATLTWLDLSHSFRITDNLDFWKPYQQIFASAVARKTDVPDGFLNVNSFLDGTQKSTCRPSDGHGRPEDAQRNWYSGYYRAHGFKMQSMMYPCGKCVFT